MIKVLFFASLKETLDCEGLDIADSTIDTVAKLRGFLAAKGDVWAKAFGQGAASNTLVAVNQTLSDGDKAIKAGDEVAFFPPVTGG